METVPARNRRRISSAETLQTILIPGDLQVRNVIGNWRREDLHFERFDICQTISEQFYPPLPFFCFGL